MCRHMSTGLSAIQTKLIISVSWLVIFKLITNDVNYFITEASDSEFTNNLS